MDKILGDQVVVRDFRTSLGGTDSAFQGAAQTLQILPVYQISMPWRWWKDLDVSVDLHCSAQLLLSFCKAA